jgi:hypothetical protein
MSNSKTAIQEIKSLMVKFVFMNEDLQRFKTSDNTIYQTSKLEAGNKIYKINEAFEQVSVKDGVYRFKENFEIEVKDEKINSVKELFLDAKLADGTVVKVDGDALLEGAKVLVVTADAEIPAPDGVHELEDGTKIETKDGVISKVEEVVGDIEEGEVPEAPEVEMGDKAIEPPLEPSLAMQKEVMDMLKDFVSKMGEKMSQMEQSYSKLETEFKAFKKEPAGRKLADGKTEFAKTNNNDDELDARVAAIIALRNNK